LLVLVLRRQRYWRLLEKKTLKLPLFLLRHAGSENMEKVK
jgi:hypothetical protein